MNIAESCAILHDRNTHIAESYAVLHNPDTNIANTCAILHDRNTHIAENYAYLHNPNTNIAERCAIFHNPNTNTAESRAVLHNRNKNIAGSCAILHEIHGCKINMGQLSVEKCPSIEADSSSPSQENPRLLMEPEISIPYSQEPTTDSYPESHESSPHSHTCFFKIDFHIIVPSAHRTLK
jgi:hypothetical protein